MDSLGHGRPQLAVGTLLILLNFELDVPMRSVAERFVL